MLTCSMGDPQRPVLTCAQLRNLAMRVRTGERPGQERKLEQRDLIRLGYSTSMSARILGLLEEEDRLDHYLRLGKTVGCVPITRVSAAYPLLLHKRLGLDCPGCLWAKGDVSLLQRSAISLVGSRDLNRENLEFAREAGRQAAKQGFVLISGNARGADKTAQDACLEAGGNVISIVADNLAQHREKLGMLYISEDGFDLPFSAQRAISRNRVIHALGWRTLVAQATLGAGGTWDGTVKNLRRHLSPVFCYADGSQAMGQLMDMGAAPITMEMLKDFGSLETDIPGFL